MMRAPKVDAVNDTTIPARQRPEIEALDELIDHFQRRGPYTYRGRDIAYFLRLYQRQVAKYGAR